MENATTANSSNEQEKDFFKNVHLVSSQGDEYLTTEKKFYNLGDIPPCNPDNSCEAIKDFIGEEDGSYDEYLRIKRDALREIGIQEDNIVELLSNVKNCMSIINECKQEIDEAFNKYVKSWQ